jgi:hypothetical protein
MGEGGRGGGGECVTERGEGGFVCKGKGVIV